MLVKIKKETVNMKYVITNDEYFLCIVAEKAKEKIKSLDGNVGDDEIVIVTIEKVKRI